MEQFGEVAPTVQTLDAPVPQVVDKLVEVFRLLDTLEDTPMRALVRGPQLAEQLVGVPMPETFVQFFDTLLDIPVVPQEGTHSATYAR